MPLVKTTIHLSAWALFVALVLLVRTASAQTSGQSVIQKKNAGAGFTQEAFTLSNGQLIGRTTAGTLSGFTLGSGLTLTGTTLSSSGGTWGSITGTLSAQTDLATALGLKAPLASPTFTGTVTATSFAGSGANLTDLPVSTSLEPGLYLPAGWDAGWLAAVAAKDSTAAEVVCLGDSITTGAGAATSNHENGFAGKLRDLLSVNKTDLAHEYIPCTNFSYTDFNHGSIVEPWTSPTGLAGYTEQFTAGLHRTYYSSATGSVFQTFTVPYDCSNAWVWVMQWSSGTAGWRKNGGAWQTISPTSVALEIQRISVGSLVAGDTIGLGNQSGGNLFRPLGIELQKDTTGISFGRLSAGSARLHDYTTGASYNPGSGGASGRSWFHMVAGMVPMTDVWPEGDFTAAYTGGFPRRPHCAIITFGANDVFTGVSAAIFRTNLSRLVAALRSGRSGCSIIIQMVHYPEQAVDESTSYMPAPAAPSVSVQGTPGATSTLVRIAYEGFYGVGLYSAATTVANAPATINGTDFLRITTSSAPTAARYIRVYTSTNGGSTWSYMQLSLASNPATVDYTSAAFSGTLPTEASALANSANWAEYVGAAMDVAQTYGCALLNWQALWAGKARAQGWMNDDIHPTAAGHLQMANKLYDLLY